MTVVTAAPPGLVRVQVGSDGRLIEMTLPDAVPVAELVPELASRLGLLEPRTVYAGYRATTAGLVLSGGSGLRAQGVRDGAVLTVTALADAPDLRVYDDAVEALAEVVERARAPVPPAVSRRTWLVAAALWFLLGGYALATVEPRPEVAVVAGAMSVAVVLAAVALARRAGEPDAAALLGWTAQLYAAIAGAVLGGPSGHALLLAGAGAVVAGALVTIGVRAGRLRQLPGVVLGGVTLAVGSVGALTDGPLLLTAVGVGGPMLLLSAGGGLITRRRPAADTAPPLAAELVTALTATAVVLASALALTVLIVFTVLMVPGGLVPP